MAVIGERAALILALGTSPETTGTSAGVEFEGLEAVESSAATLPSQTLGVGCCRETMGHLLSKARTGSDWTRGPSPGCTRPPWTAFCMCPRSKATVWLVPSRCR